MAISGPASAREARHAAMMLDANTGAVLHDEDGDDLRHPASLTKMMTLYLTFETIESGRLSMSDRIVISDTAASVAPSKLELEPGEDIAVSDAIKALITKSANDVAVALAEKIGGSQTNFVRLMNARAKDLGMSKTHFENASGLPNDDQVTTAHDMITLGMRLQDDFPTYYPMFAMREFRYKGATHRNHNTMLNTFAGIDGIKTGYTSASGFNLVTSVHRGGKHVIGAVFGGSSAATRNGEMRILLTRALTRASAVKTRKPSPALIAKLKLKSEPKLAQRPAAKPKTGVQVADAVAPEPARQQVQPVAAAKAAAVAPKPAVPAKPAAPIAETTVADAAPVDAEAPEKAAPISEAAPVLPPKVDASLPPAPVQIFKVKRIAVTPKPAPRPDETTDTPEDTTADEPRTPSAPASAPRLALASLSRPAGEPTIESLVAAHEAAQADPSETVVAKTTPGRPLDTTQMTMLGARDAIPADAPASQPATQTVAELRSQPVARPVPPVATLPSAMKPSATPTPKPTVAAKLVAIAKPAPAAQPVARGLPPSTLQAQAVSMMTTSANRQAAADSAAGGFEIQIGAYDSVDEAQRMLSAVQNKSGKLLAGYPSVTHPVQKGGKQVYRARFRGFTAQSAATTCASLKSQSVDCFVMTTE